MYEDEYLVWIALLDQRLEGCEGGRIQLKTFALDW